MGQISSFTQEITPSHVRFAANFVRAAIRLAQIAGVSQDQVRDVSLRIDALEASLEGDYEGAETDGEDLATWFKKRSSKP